MERSIRIVRDLLAIVLMVIVLVFGWRLSKAIGDARENQPAIIQTPPLPVDRCGGGLCNTGKNN
jgi:hypothetical protein